MLVVNLGGSRGESIPCTLTADSPGQLSIYLHLTLVHSMCATFLWYSAL